jgi:ABC-type multidrug transport system fused ATPase/permease subunit
MRAALDTPAAVRAPAAPVAAPSPATEPLHFDGVRYSYPGRHGEVLRGVDLVLEPGRTTAIVGPSGAGKSTLAALALRLADPTAGRVRCGPIDLADVDPEAWRAHCACVLQDARVYAGTVAENLRLGRADAGDDELWEALRAAGAAELVAALPSGLQTRVGEGGRRLSAGEARRLTIARAFVRDAPLLVLDEPTADLDPESVALIAAALARLRADRTVLLIAHRLELVAHADRVIRLVDGVAVPEPLRQAA